MQSFDDWLQNEGLMDNPIARGIATTGAMLAGSFLGSSQAAHPTPTQQVNFMNAKNKRQIEITISVPKGPQTSKTMAQKINLAIAELNNQMQDAVNPNFVKNGGIIRIQGVTDQNGNVITAQNLARFMPKEVNGLITMPLTVHIGYGQMDRASGQILPVRAADALRR